MTSSTVCSPAKAESLSESLWLSDRDSVFYEYFHGDLYVKCPDILLFVYTDGCEVLKDIVDDDPVYRCGFVFAGDRIDHIDVFSR